MRGRVLPEAGRGARVVAAGGERRSQRRRAGSSKAAVRYPQRIAIDLGEECEPSQLIQILRHAERLVLQSTEVELKVRRRADGAAPTLLLEGLGLGEVGCRGLHLALEQAEGLLHRLHLQLQCRELHVMPLGLCLVLGAGTVRMRSEETCQHWRGGVGSPGRPYARRAHLLSVAPVKIETSAEVDG